MAEPVYERFDSNAGFQEAVDRLLGQPGRELRVFDPDGASLRLNDAARVSRLEGFLQASRTRRLYMVVHSADHITRHCPRMMSLLARYAHAIQIYRTGEEIRELQDAFLVLDALRVMHKDGSQELLLSRIRKLFPREADALAYTFASLDEHDARGWIDRLARLYQLTLLEEADLGEYAEPLTNRPLGLMPGARAWV